MVGKLYNHILLLLGVLLFAFYLTTTSYAAINEQLTFYGTLQNSSGSNLSGTYDMVFRFYDAPTGGTLLDTSTHTAGNGNPVTVSNGEFTVQLGSGSGNALDGIDFNTTAIYVGLSVDADPEMTPRERLSAAAYAFNADRLDGYDATDFLRTNATGSITVTDPDTLLTITQNGTGDLLNLFDGGTEVFSILDGGNVGIGTSAPAYQLSVAGDMQLTGALYDSTNSAGPSGYVLQSTGSGLEWVASSTLGLNGGSGGGGGPLFEDNGSTTNLISLADNVALGVTTASHALTIAGSLGIDEFETININGVNFISATNTLDNAIGIGLRAMQDSIHPDDSVFVGTDAGASSTYPFRVVSIGTGAGSQGGVTLGNDMYQTVLIGYQAGYYLDDYGDTAYVGPYAGYRAVGYGGNGFGYEASASSTDNSGFSLSVGYRAGFFNDNYENEMIGTQAGEYIQDCCVQIMGYQAGQYTDEFYSDMIGYRAGASSTGNRTVMIGTNAGLNNRGNENVFVGESTGINNAGQNNTFFGTRSGFYHTGTNTTAIGARALEGTATFETRENQVLGYEAGRGLQTGGNENLFIGYRAGDNVTTGTRNIVIGYDLDVQDPTQTQTMTIGNLLFGTGFNGTFSTLSTGSIGIGTSSPSAQLTTTGSVRLANFGAGTLQTDASGNVSVSSDERLKNVVENFNDGLASILGIEPIVYKWNNESGFETETEYIGFSAQNVQDNIPGAVGKDKHGFLTLSDRGILASVVNAVRELWSISESVATTTIEHTEQVEQLQARLAEQEAVLTEYEADVVELETTLGIETEVVTESDESSTTTPAIPETATTTATSTNTNTE